MSRCTYVLRDGELVPKHMATPLHAADAAPMIRTDGMDPVRSMANGQMYDSRSRYYGDLKAGGYEIVGNDRAAFDVQPRFDPGPVGPDIKRAMEELASR